MPKTKTAPKAKKAKVSKVTGYPIGSSQDLFARAATSGKHQSQAEAIEASWATKVQVNPNPGTRESHRVRCQQMLQEWREQGAKIVWQVTPKRKP